MSHVEELLPDAVLGLLGAAERAKVDAHLPTCEACRRAAAELADAADAVALGFAPAGGLSQLEQALAGGKRFEHLVEPVAKLFDLSAEAARELLSRVDDEANWLEGPAPGVRLMSVEAGPARAGLIAALLRLDAGATFPDHEHGAEEQVLVLEGGYRCSTGVEVWRGGLDVRAKGTSHAFTALEGLTCLCASVTAFPGDDA
jgi:putative transcriptional regulator